MGGSTHFFRAGRWLLVGIVAIMAAAVVTPALAHASALSQSRDHLFGSLAGLRTELAKHGMSLGVTDSENLLGNIEGGVKRGATLQGVATFSLDIDAAKAFGVKGGKFHISALQIHGKSLSGPYLDVLQGVNGDEAEDTTRLWELWYDQTFDRGRFDVKAGQQSIDNEFLISKYSSLFLNTMAGWPLVPSVDLYGGGPAYPLSSLGVRIRFRPTRHLTILAGVFDDNPGGGPFSADAQALDASGTRFNLNTGALFIGELQYRRRLGGLPGTYKLGGWYDTGGFPDQFFDVDGLPLAPVGTRDDPLMHRGNYSVYGVVDQTVWQSGRDHARTLNVFGRIMGAPVAQNLVDFFFNGGITLTAPFPGRKHDSAGIDFGVGRVSPRAADLDRDAGLPVRSEEKLIELTYQAQVTGWLQLQPDIQYVTRPGAGVLDPADPTHLLHNELVIGIRTNFSF